MGARPGPFYATAPEVLQGEEYDYSADVYSYGILIWDLVKLWMRLTLRDSMPKILLEVVCECLVLHKSDRPSMRQIHRKLDSLNQEVYNDLEKVEMIDVTQARENVFSILGHESETAQVATSKSDFISISIDDW